jgi:acyl carrier protein
VTQAEIASAVRKFLVENFLFGAGADSLSDDTSFLSAGLIDSTGVLELVFFLENTYGIKVADEEMLPDNLDSVAQVAAYVHRKAASGAAAPVRTVA